MDVWKLPKSVKVNGKEYRIRSDYRAVLDILCAINDPDIVAGMSEEEKNLEIYTTILAIFYEDFDNLPTEDWEEALKTAKEFIDCGFKEDKKKPQECLRCLYCLAVFFEFLVLLHKELLADLTIWLNIPKPQMQIYLLCGGALSDCKMHLLQLSVRFWKL